MAKQMPWYERIKQARLERNLSQADLAKKLGASPKAIQRWEKGKSRPQPLWRGKLCEFFQLSSEELSFLPTRGKAVLAYKGPVAVIEGDRVAGPQRYIVGRQAEVQLFDELLSGQKDYHLLNIYGPGGMGKSVVCGKLRTHAHAHNVPTAVVDGSHPDLTPDSILDDFKQSLMEGPFKEQLEVGFREFESQLHEYSLVNYLMAQAGDVHTLFDTFGNIKDQSKFAALLAGLHENLPQSLERTIHNRFALDRYLRGAERSLTTCFVRTLATLQEELRCSIALLIDTYEEMEQLDTWVCRTLVPSLPPGVRLVILGRNELYRVNFDWRDNEQMLHTHVLPELSESEARAYLHHYGLTNEVALQHIYDFTGGYPLLLFLAWLLAKDAGGWGNIGMLEQSRDRDAIATQLLELILREERVQEVRAFLEEGAVAQWFTPEIITVILDVDSAQARAIYDKLKRHSFVERHPFGMRLHDKIRELLEDRLKFTSEAEYHRLRDKLATYYAEKANLPPKI